MNAPKLYPQANQKWILVVKKHDYSIVQTESALLYKFTFLVLLSTAVLHAQLTTFTAGSPTKAAEVNGNFTYLQARGDSLSKALASKDSATRAFQKAPSWSDSLAGLKSRIDSVSTIRAQVRLDSMVKALQSKDTAIAALKSAPQWADSLT
jgi:hypothetical protein